MFGRAASRARRGRSAARRRGGRARHARALERLSGFAPQLKWPNDLIVGDRKLGGRARRDRGHARRLRRGRRSRRQPDLRGP